MTLLGQAQGYQDGKAKNHLFKPNPFIFLKHKWDQRITELSNHEKDSNLSSETPDLLDFHDSTAAAKLLQSCLILCDLIDGSPPGSPVPGILKVRTLEWVAISFSNA